MKFFMQSFESWLRMERLQRTSDILRARAVYLIAVALIVSQFANMLIMTRTYGYWTMDHWTALGASVSFLGSIVALRYTTAFYLFAGFYSLLLFLAVSAASLFDFTGINSALLPYLLLGSIVCGFISGWRMVVAFGVAAIALVWGLYHVSATAPQGVLFDPTLFNARNIQRAVQITIVLSLATAITGFASFAMHSALLELEENAAQANQASEAKTRFMSDMSHELRTPLNGVMGMSEILMETQLNMKQFQCAGMINKSARNLLAILNNMLDISHLDANTFTIECAPFNLQELFNSVIRQHKATAKSKGLAIGIHYSKNIPKDFVGDANAIRQIINNLMSNAIKFTHTGSTYIHVDGEMESGAEAGDKCQLVLSVQDTGIGIAPENTEKIFNRFSQLDTGLSRKYEGTGLGLSLSKNIAELIGGELSVLSYPGEGATFMLKLALPIGETSTVITLPLDMFHPPTEDLIQISHDPGEDVEKRAVG